MSKRAGKGGGRQAEGRSLPLFEQNAPLHLLQHYLFVPLWCSVDRSKVQPGKLPLLLLSDVTRCASVELASWPAPGVHWTERPGAPWAVQPMPSSQFCVWSSCLSAVCLLSLAEFLLWDDIFCQLRSLLINESVDFKARSCNQASISQAAWKYKELDMLPAWIQ